MTADIAQKLRKIADASRRDDGSDIPLGEQCREAADHIDRLTKSEADLIAKLSEVAHKLKAMEDRAEAAETLASQKANQYLAERRRTERAEAALAERERVIGELAAQAEHCVVGFAAKKPVITGAMHRLAELASSARALIKQDEKEGAK